MEFFEVLLSTKFAATSICRRCGNHGSHSLVYCWRCGDKFTRLLEPTRRQLMTIAFNSNDYGRSAFRADYQAALLKRTLESKGFTEREFIKYCDDNLIS